ncbi:FAD-linked oxidase C-terminal domain-containing protein [Mycobacterium sp.]|jgi:glycolate oxidase|uniref:FAD-linked oxidase C-terminal domain-containing protein n=1 Tax=Mycobacterium sp. TaxID=1785 RepID=UPI002D3CB039|nr:FAD-linked oxidase C-terminal domain-containing protein [Mycobacterium sp.]HZA12733.1 FAD-linked oxidase C-terminal domain-containing protein [Mycobacterium sp.]
MTMTTTYLDLVAEKGTGRVTDEVRREIGDLVSEGGLITEPAQLRTYECDGLTGFRVVPALVVLPACTEEVAAVVRVCAREHIPFVARGAGTGLSGGALPAADGVVIGLARMRKIISVDAENQRAVVQPGVTNLGISAAVAAHDLYFAPDPSSQVVCTIGGNVAENSGGAHCLKYGFTTNHVLGLTMVCPDGSVVTVGGDSLDQVGPDLRALVVGSEGTLGIVTEIIVRLLRKPDAVRTLVADFADVEHAGNTVSDIVSHGIIPAAVEMLDELAIEACEKATGAGYTVGSPAALVVELDGVGVEVDAEFEHVQRMCQDNQATHIRIAQDQDERALIWKGRKAAFAAMGRISPDYFVQDGVIPRTKLGATLTRIGQMSREHGLRVANVFHAGDGNLHPLVLYDNTVEGQAEQAEELATAIVELCVEQGGSITGEHGVGSDKACSMPKMFTDSDLTVMALVRAAFDPEGVCNPGKVLPTPRLCGERPGPWRPHPLEQEGVIERF